MSITNLKFDISRNSQTPMWLQIRDELYNCLHKEILRPGQLIPNEKTLVELFNVSIGTIRKAIGALENEGILIRKQGLGTFVFEHDANSFQFKYFHFALRNTKETVIPNVELISFERKKATKSEIEIFNLPADNKNVFHIYNKLGFNNKFYIVDKIVISVAKFLSLTEEMYVNRNNTIYNLYQNKFNIFITDCSEKIRTVAASEETAKILDIDINTPLLRIDRIGYTYHNEIVEIRTSYVHTSDIDYVRPQFSALGE